MAKKNKTFEAFKNLTFITQFGLSVVSPIIIYVWLASWLKSKFLLGDWIMVVGIILGLISAFSSGVSFFRYVLRQAKNSQEEDDE